MPGSGALAASATRALLPRTLSTSYVTCKCDEQPVLALPCQEARRPLHPGRRPLPAPCGAASVDCARMPLTAELMEASPSHLLEHAFVIEAPEAEQLHAELGTEGDDEAFLARLVPPTQRLARPPISHFQVGAVGLGKSGRVYRGVNVEFPGLPLQHSIHAEQFLVTNALLHGERALELLAVSAAPCGHCRQFLGELPKAGQLRIVIADKKAETKTLPELLPHRFGPHDLLEGKNLPLLLEERDNGLVLEGGGAAGPKSLLEAALEAANRSYSPYSHCPSGLALRTAEGRVFSGPYLECAAYNPSLNPLQAAVVALIAQGGGDISDAVEVVLVESRGAPVKHYGTVKMALEQIAPSATLQVHYLQ